MQITLFKYLSKHFLKSIFMMFCLVIIAISITDFLELLRRVSGSSNINIVMLFAVIALKLPFFIQETYPFSIFIAAIYSFYHLSKKNEYIIMKASGLSIWQFIFPYILLALISSILVITILNPISAKCLLQEKKIKTKLFNNNVENNVTLLESGIWFVDRTVDDNINVIIHANKVMITSNETKLIDPYFVYIDKNSSFIKSIKAIEASLNSDKWELHNAIEFIPQENNRVYVRYSIPTATSAQELHNSFTKPKYISVWDLPYFISVLKKSGHSAKEYILSFYKIAIKPFITVSLIVLSSVFCLKPFRIFKPTYLIVLSIVIGFFMYCFTEITLAASINSNLSPIIATFSLAVIINAVSVFALQYSENY